MSEPVALLRKAINNVVTVKTQWEFDSDAHSLLVDLPNKKDCNLTEFKGCFTLEHSFRIQPPIRDTFESKLTERRGSVEYGRQYSY